MRVYEIHVSRLFFDASAVFCVFRRNIGRSIGAGANTVEPSSRTHVLVETSVKEPTQGERRRRKR